MIPVFLSPPDDNTVFIPFPTVLPLVLCRHRGITASIAQFSRDYSSLPTVPILHPIPYLLSPNSQSANQWFARSTPDPFTSVSRQLIHIDILLFASGKFGTGQISVMPGGCKGNHEPGGK